MFEEVRGGEWGVFRFGFWFYYYLLIGLVFFLRFWGLLRRGRKRREAMERGLGFFFGVWGVV